MFILLIMSNINNIIETLDNNLELLELTSKKIKMIIFTTLKRLQLSSNTIKDYMFKLKQYKLVDQLKDIKSGSYIRWIKLDDPSYELKNGALICDIIISNSGILLKCKKFGNNIFQISLDNTVVFQKLTNQELVILNALDYLEK